MTDRIFGQRVLLIAGIALVWRVAVTLVVARRIGGDPAYYTQQGRLIAEGHWFVEPYYLKALGVYDPSAAHPPLFSLFFAALSFVGLDTDGAYRVAAACLGGAVVLAIGYAARRVAGARVGLVAAVLAAVYPYLWSTDMLVLSETLLALFAALIVLTTFRYLDAPSTARLACVGLAIAGAALTRSESLLLVPLLAVPLAWRGDGGARARLRRVAVVGVATVVPLLPWIAYNLSRFDEPVFLSTNGGGTFADSYCDEVFYGPKTGWWEQLCIVEFPGDESVRDRELREHAFEYLVDHQGRLPAVVAVRIGRVWQVYEPWWTARLDWLEGRGRFVGAAALTGHLAVIPFAIAGAFVLHGRRRSLLPFVAIVAGVTLTAAVFYGAVRFRAPADVVLVVLAAVTVDACWSASRPARNASRAAYQVDTSATDASTATIGSAAMRNR
jgi:4-amino-4-deoxy-L-arabinose transferase-like glycosyltransferase